MSDDYKQIAALALAKCAAYDPWFPKASQATVDAWAEAIAEYRLSLPDVMEGVKVAYRDNGSGFKPLPRDIVQAARAFRADRIQREGLDERRAREDARDLDYEKAWARIAARTGQKTLGRNISEAS